MMSTSGVLLCGSVRPASPAAATSRCKPAPSAQPPSLAFTAASVAPPCVKDAKLVWRMRPGGVASLSAERNMF